MKALFALLILWNTSAFADAIRPDYSRPITTIKRQSFSDSRVGDIFLSQLPELQGSLYKWIRELEYNPPSFGMFRAWSECWSEQSSPGKVYHYDQQGILGKGQMRLQGIGPGEAGATSGRSDTVFSFGCFFEKRRAAKEAVEDYDAYWKGEGRQAELRESISSVSQQLQSLGRNLEDQGVNLPSIKYRLNADLSKFNLRDVKSLLSAVDSAIASKSKFLTEQDFHVEEKKDTYHWGMP